MKSPARLPRWWFALALAAIGMHALAQSDPPARVGSLSAVEGSVVMAPTGETEWADAPRNRPVTTGDRLWTDTGARADVHLGTAVLHVDSESFLEVRALDTDVLQALLHEGAVQARVRALHPGELFEIATPQLAVRILQPGTFRIDADPGRHVTRVAVRDGLATISGASGRLLTLYQGQQVEVAGTDLEQVASVSARADDFDAWADDRNEREDQSLAARFLPPEVVGASQLDAWGNWIQDPTYGVVWYPGTPPVDWAPYRYGRWQWVRPWGWTWIDQAPWGFAPFHYGRWTLIGSRWAWVPGRLGPRPVYAPALVNFVGGGASGPLPVGAGQGIAWYPLAPGEVWRPFFPATPAYLRRANESLAGAPLRDGAHRYQRRPDAVTALRIEDFRSGAPVQRRWERPHPADLARAQPLLPPPAIQPPVANAAPRGLPSPRAAAPGNVQALPAPLPRVRAPESAVGRYPAPASPDEARARSQQEQPWPHQTLPPSRSGAIPLAPQSLPQQKGPQHELRPSDQEDGLRRRQAGRVS